MDLHSAAETKRPRAGILLVGFLLLGLSGSGKLLAQEVHTENRLNRDYLNRFGRDFTAVITAPSRWDRGDILTLAAVSGGGLLLMAFDEEIMDWAEGRKTETTRNAASFFTLFGDGLVLAGLSAAVYTAGEIGHDDGLRKTALLSLESLATASFIAWTVKIIAGRARPYTGESSGSFHPFTLDNSFWSFPSGHATAAFSVATIIALQSKALLVDIAAYSLAGLAGISRFHDNKHWVSDIFVGSALGYFVAKKIYDLNRPGEKKTLSFGFQCFGGRQALTLNIAF